MKYVIFIILVVFGLITIAYINSNNKDEFYGGHKIYSYNYDAEYKIDSLTNELCASRSDVSKLADDLYETKRKIDSLTNVVFVDKYKIERIRYYTDIAKNGNNIKYLRGWIYRVINE